jgi:hypothetical protein
MPAPQIATIGENQTADERHGLPKHLVADHVSQAVGTGFEQCTDVHQPHQGGPLGRFNDLAPGFLGLSVASDDRG